MSKKLFNIVNNVTNVHMKFGAVLAFVLAIVALCIEIGLCSPHIRIVDNRQPLCVIVISDNASDQVQSVANLLSRYIELSSKASIPVLRSSELAPRGSRIKIWLGPGDYQDKLRFDMGGMDEDGFLIKSLNEENIVVIGPSDWGTEFGVYEFLERYVGVRWLLPGPDGEYVPEHTTLDVPIEEVREKPAFFSRQLAGLRGEEQTIWARRNRMHGRIKFHHNLFRLYPPEKYTKNHPEFFPMIKGKRYIHPIRRSHGWQPCFSAPGIIEEAIKNISNYFSQHPEEKSYSLGVNDARGHCECEKCRQRDSGRINFLGRRDFSDRYFEWANAVVKGVLKKYPDKWFGCLAYGEVAEPSSRVSVHPRIIPYMTYDRMKWIDQGIEKEGKRVTELWEKKASRLGWYDYIYGTPYLLPRVYFHKMADYYRYGYKHGVRAMFAEAYPNWGEGPKLYLVLKLQWNPDLDVDALLKDWYVCAVGRDAAPYLAAYYDLWESFWTQSIKESKWFRKNGRRQYLNFWTPGYLSLVKHDSISRSRQLLKQVLANARTRKQQRRAQLLLRAFEYYEASAVSYLGLVKNIKQAGKNEHFYERINEKRFTLINEFENDPVLMHPIRFDNRKARSLRWGKMRHQDKF